jgi:hypothetical protein
VLVERVDVDGGGAGGVGEVGHQESGIRNQESGIRNQGTGIREQESGNREQGTEDQDLC